MASHPIPVVVCGKTEQIGRPVVAGLKPEIDTVHFVLTPEAGAAEIPLVLQGKTPESTSSQIGSGNLSRTPRAVVLGGAYDEASFVLMREAVQKADGPGRVLWLRNDTSKPAPPIGPEYGKAIIARVKEKLLALEAEGKLNGKADEVIWY